MFLNIGFFKCLSFFKLFKSDSYFLNISFNLKNKNINKFFNSIFYSFFFKLAFLNLKFFNFFIFYLVKFKKHFNFFYKFNFFLRQIRRWRGHRLTSLNNYFKTIRYSFVSGVYSLIFFKNNFFNNTGSVNQIFNFKNNLSILAINSYSNYKSVLAILNFIFLFIVFVQKIVLFLNSIFLSVAHKLLDAFRVYLKSNDVFNKIYAIFGSDFGLKYYFNSL